MKGLFKFYGWLIAWLSGLSTIVDYLMLNPFIYIYIYIYILNIHDL